jgi:hypothetical protein|tara:strand:- start:784 stop:999 length:216 start_codon:yes stop_codon:yes gene_type:complete
MDNEKTSTLLHIKNKELFKEIDKLDEMKKLLFHKINENKKKIHSICNHEWEIEIVYGERTQYFCNKCGFYK